MRKEYLINIVLLLLSIIAPIIALDAFISITYKEDLAKLKFDRWRYRSHPTAPTAYSNSDYISDQFLEESIKSVEFKADNTLKPRQGRYFNVNANGFRVTFNPASQLSKVIPPKNIYIYGGSTVFGQETPDSMTIPSILSLKTSKYCQDPYVIHNMGIPAYRTDEQLSLLLKNAPQKDSIVIFYDGYNDFHYNIYRNNPEFKSHFELENEARDTLLLFQKISELPVIGSSATYKYFTKLAAHSFNHQDEELAIEASNLYWKNIDSASKFTKKNGSTFVHVVQPTIFNSQAKTDSTKYLINHPSISSAGEQSAFEKYFNIMISGDNYQDLDGSNQSLDLTRIFSDSEGSDYFLDHVHVNESANEKITDKIFKHLQALINCQTKI